MRFVYDRSFGAGNDQVLVRTLGAGGLSRLAINCCAILRWRKKWRDSVNDCCRSNDAIFGAATTIFGDRMTRFGDRGQDSSNFVRNGQIMNLHGKNPNSPPKTTVLMGIRAHFRAAKNHWATIVIFGPLAHFSCPAARPFRGYLFGPGSPLRDVVFGSGSPSMLAAMVEW